MTGAELIIVAFAVAFAVSLILLARSIVLHRAKALSRLTDQQSNLHKLVLSLVAQAEELSQDIEYRGKEAAGHLKEPAEKIHRDLVSLSEIVDNIGDLLRDKTPGKSKQLLLRSTDQATKLLERLRETKQSAKLITKRKD